MKIFIPPKEVNMKQQMKVFKCIVVLIVFFAIVSYKKKEGTKQNVCVYNNLSDKYIYEILTKKKISGDRTEVTDVYITITAKADLKKIQTIHRFGDEVKNLSKNTFKNPIASRSYVTGFKKNIKAIDGDYGDLIIVDFNFDNREDFAIVKDFGFAYFYDFYYQNENNRFIIDTFFSNHNSGLFPKFDTDKKTMIYSGRNGSLGFWSEYYKFEVPSKKWILEKSEQENN